MVEMSVMYVGQPADPAALDATRRTPGHFRTGGRLDAALASPERKVSAGDVKRFPTFHGPIKRQIFRVRSYFP